MKKWLIYRHHDSGQFRNERLFDEETHRQVERHVSKPVGTPAGTLSYTATFVEILKGEEVVNSVEGEFYDVVETNAEFRQRDMLKMLARLNGVAQVMES